MAIRGKGDEEFYCIAKRCCPSMQSKHALLFGSPTAMNRDDMLMSLLLLRDGDALLCSEVHAQAEGC